MTAEDIASAMIAQTNTLLQAFNPEVIEFRNRVNSLRQVCPHIEWEHDMGATIPFCRLDDKFCNGQCVFRTNRCPCEEERQ